MSFSKIFQIFSIVGSTFPIFIPECLNNSWWCFSSSFSTFEDRRRVFPPNLTCSLNTRGASLMPSSHNCFRLWEFFSPIWSISWVVSISFLRRPSFQILFIPAFSYCSPNVTGASFNYYPISSWSLHSLVSKFPQVSLFVFKFLPVIHPLTSFVFQFLRWFVQELSFFVVISIHSLFQSYRRFIEDLLKFTLYLS